MITTTRAMDRTTARAMMPAAVALLPTTGFAMGGDGADAVDCSPGSGVVVTDVRVPVAFDVIGVPVSV